MAQPHKVWFMTGTSRGFGRVWAEAVVERGDKLAAAARDTGSLTKLARRYGDDILPIRLDVSNAAAVDAAVARAHDYFGRLDVIVNNADHFGALCVTQAALPYLRAQGSGHIIQLASTGTGQSVAEDVRDFGIRISVVEPTATARGILSIVDADEPPVPVFVGQGRLEIIRPGWRELSEQAHRSAELALQR
jgi:hypothetical protein